MARPVARRVRADAPALPQWIRPQLTELVDAAPDGRVFFEGFTAAGGA
jgi:hypothetical protein